MRSCTILACAFLLAVLPAGCGTEKSEIRLSIRGYPQDGPAPELLVRLRDGLRVLEYTLDAETKSVGPIGTGSAGTLSVEFTVLHDGVPTETAGSIALPLKRDWRWGVDFSITVNDPMDTCFGCFGSEEFELDPVLGYDSQQRLYVVWGGHSISNPVVY